MSKPHSVNYSIREAESALVAGVVGTLSQALAEAASRETAPVVYLTTTDPVIERLIDLLDAHTSIGVIHARDGATILSWETTLELARHIASDAQLRALILGDGGGQAA